MERKIKTLKDIVSLQIKGASNVAYKIVSDTSKADFDMSTFGKLTSSSDAKKIIENYLDREQMLSQEVFGVMCLNQSNAVVGIFTPFAGGISSSVVDYTIISALAIATMSRGIILFHNHPSGNKYPSDADRTVTRESKDALKLFKISVTDHIILAPATNSYYSFADEGMI